jgi:hypothetical protein
MSPATGQQDSTQAERVAYVCITLGTLIASGAFITLALFVL